MSHGTPADHRFAPSDIDAAYAWLLAMCRGWLLARSDAVDRDAYGSPPSCWATIAKMAHFHGVAPILHAWSCESPGLAADVPGAVREEWERAYYTTRLKNIEMLQALSQIFDACAPAGIEVLALKGPAAIADVYHDVALRPMADLDVLCRPADLPALAVIARSLGFLEAGPPHFHQVDFYDRRRDLLLELHFDAYHFVRRKHRFLETAWRDARTVSVEEWTIRVMSPEHQAVFDLAHCVQDGFEVALKHVADFAGRALPGGRPLRGEAVAALAEETGLSETFSLFVTTIAQLLEIPIAVPACPALPADRLASFASFFVERSKSIGFRKPIAGGPFLREPGAARKIAFLWKRLFPPLTALQASCGRRSRVRAVPDVPIHAARTLLDAVQRVRRDRRSGG